MATRVIELILHGNASQAIGEMEKLATATDVAGAGMHAKLSSWAQKTTLAMAGLGIGVAAVSVKLADDFEIADARLKTSLKNSGISFASVSPQIDKTNTSMEKFGYSNTETENAMSRLVIATKDVSKSQRDLGIAADIAAARHISLEQATDLLVKTEGGRYVGLTRTLGVSKDVIASFHSQADAVDYLATHFTGQAAAGAETFQGKVKALQAQLEDIGIKIGQAVIPVIEDLASALSSVITWFKQNEDAAKALGIAIGTVLAAAVSIFAYDKAVAFVAGLQRMATGLGLMGAQATATAAEVETSAASMDGAGVAAGGAGASIAGIVLPLALAAGAAYGLYTAFNEAGISVDVNSQKLATMSNGALAQSITKLVDFGNKWGDASAANKAFNKILDDTPQFAQKFIDAANAAGLSTDGFSRKLREHQQAAEEAKVAQERMTLQMELLDAKARGDSASVYGLTLQLNALPTDKQIQVAVYGNALSVLGDIHGQINGLDGKVVTATVNVVKSTIGF